MSHHVRVVQKQAKFQVEYYEWFHFHLQNLVCNHDWHSFIYFSILLSTVRLVPWVTIGWY